MLQSLVSVNAEAAKPGEISGLQHTRTEFEKLSSSEKTSRQSWLKLSNTFRSIHKASKGQESAVSLFFAGKSLVQCYKAHGNAQDLDNGIKILNEYKKLKIATQYDRQALVEIKDAHLLKRKIRSRVTCSVDTRTNHSKVTNNISPGPRGKKVERYEMASVKDLPNPVAQDVVKSEKVNINSIESRPAITRLGNPYYNNNLPVQPEKKEVEAVKTASLPPQVVTDTMPLRKGPESRLESRVIVLDPGHGGKDPGAVSRDGSLTEKEVTLRIARKLKSSIEKSVPNVTVKLTRDGDTFLSLKDRTAIANAANADLFVSIHCNGSEYASASGVETFFLSQANSRGAMRAAARENGIALSKMNHLEATLIDLMMTSKRTESGKLAEIIHESLMDTGNRKTGKMRDRGVKQAPFYVLMGATMPAILVECAFISNMSEKNDLKNEAYIDSLAKKITLGAKKYLEELGRNG